MCLFSLLKRVKPIYLICSETVGPSASKCDKDIMIYLFKKCSSSFFIQTNSGQFKYSFISKKGCPHTLGHVMYLDCWRDMAFSLSHKIKMNIFNIIVI